jgi:hypothetical protein
MDTKIRPAANKYAENLFVCIDASFYRIWEMLLHERDLVKGFFWDPLAKKVRGLVTLVDASFVDHMGT